MKAIIRRRFGGPEVLGIENVATPVPAPGQVLIRVHAFGLNHAELYMRRGQWGEVAPISGIECVGTIAEDPSGRMKRGQTVIAAMGGMGRAINGSYAEYVAVPAVNMVALSTDLPWQRLALLPESYGVAWSCLSSCLNIQAGQRLLVRGASSAFGRAALDIAHLLGVRATGTTRNAVRAARLRELRADDVIVTDGPLAPSHSGGFDAVLDLLGNNTMLDSLRLARPGGRVCVAGFLAGLAPLAQFNPLTDMPSTVQLSFFGSFNFGSAGHRMEAIPYQRMADALADGTLRGNASAVFEFGDIVGAHSLMENGEADGKIVVRMTAVG